MLHFHVSGVQRDASQRLHDPSPLCCKQLRPAGVGLHQLHRLVQVAPQGRGRLAGGQLRQVQGQADVPPARLPLDRGPPARQPPWAVAASQVEQKGVHLVVVLSQGQAQAGQGGAVVKGAHQHQVP